MHVSPEQLPLVSGYQSVALVILAKAHIRLGDLAWEPLALISEGSVVGVLAVAHSPTQTELFHLAIDAGRRGGEWGQWRSHSSLETLRTFVLGVDRQPDFPTCTTVSQSGCSILSAA